jgi:hypothetical protein
MPDYCICTFNDHGHKPERCQNLGTLPDGYCQDCFELVRDEAEATRADAGMNGQGSIVRSMNRLRRSLDKYNKSTGDYNNWILCLTVVLTLLTILQLIRAFSKSN